MLIHSLLNTGKLDQAQAAAVRKVASLFEYQLNASVDGVFVGVKQFLDRGRVIIGCSKTDMVKTVTSLSPYTSHFVHK